MWEQSRKQRYGDVSVGSAGIQAVTAAGGSAVGINVTLAMLGLASKIEGMINVEITSTVPTVNNASAYAALAGTSTVIGVTLAAGSGTTINAIVTALGI